MHLAVPPNIMFHALSSSCPDILDISYRRDPGSNYSTCCYQDRETLPTLDESSRCPHDECIRSRSPVVSSSLWIWLWRYANMHA